MRKFFYRIKTELNNHWFDYLLLLTGGVFFLIALKLFQGERLIEFIILLAFTSIYIIWGIYHHIIENTLHLKIMLEYIFIGFIALLLLKLIII